jgi:ElaA protein
VLAAARRCSRLGYGLGVSDQVRIARFAELDPSTLYDFLRLRSEVFVVEQHCVFLDLDGRDMDPSTIHLWLERDGAMLGYARVLPGEDVTEVGRIVTPIGLRGQGIGARLMLEALTLIEGPVALKAQAQLSAWYQQFGFEVTGQAFMEDGIPHVPMRFDR